MRRQLVEPSIAHPFDIAESPFVYHPADLRVAFGGRIHDEQVSVSNIAARGAAVGKFHVASPRLASYAILDLGMGLAVWFREDGELSENEITWQYIDFALRLVGAG